jgi:hypothetical protein
VSAAVVDARAIRTCSIERKGPVSPVLTARFPRIAARTTSAGDRVVARSSPDTAIRAARPMRTARLPSRSAGRRTARGQTGARDERESHGHADALGAEAEAGRVEGKEDTEEAIAVCAERFGGEDGRDDAVGGRPGHGRYDPPGRTTPSRVEA